MSTREYPTQPSVCAPLTCCRRVCGGGAGAGVAAGGLPRPGCVQLTGTRPPSVPPCSPSGDPSPGSESSHSSGRPRPEPEPSKSSSSGGAPDDTKCTCRTNGRGRRGQHRVVVLLFVILSSDLDDVPSRPVPSRPVPSRPVSSRLVSSCPVLSCPVLSCPVLSCPVLSPVSSRPVPSRPVPSRPVPSHSVPSCSILFRPPFFALYFLTLFRFCSNLGQLFMSYNHLLFTPFAYVQ